MKVPLTPLTFECGQMLDCHAFALKLVYTHRRAQIIRVQHEVGMLQLVKLAQTQTRTRFFKALVQVSSIYNSLMYHQVNLCHRAIYVNWNYADRACVQLT